MPWYRVYAKCVEPLEIEADSEGEAYDMIDLEDFEWDFDVLKKKMMKTAKRNNNEECYR